VRLIKISELMFFEPDENEDYSRFNYSCEKISDIDKVVEISQETVWKTKGFEKASEFLNETGQMIVIYKDGEKYAGTFRGWETIYLAYSSYKVRQPEAKEIKKQCNLS